VRSVGLISPVRLISVASSPIGTIVGLSFWNYDCVRSLHRLLRSPKRTGLGRFVFILVLLGVLLYFVFGPPDRLETGDKLASIGALILAAGAMILSASPGHAVDMGSGSDDLLAAELAGLVERQWAREAAVRLLRRPRPLTVRWSLTGDAAAPAVEVFGPAACGGGRVLRGDVSDIAAAFRGIPGRRVVVVGASGSGKTVLALLLTLDLVASRDPDEPAPVLLSVSSWDPREHLDGWLARRLAEEYPTLADRRRYGEDALLRLVRTGRVLPVLDGLDEMCPRRRPAAITALNTAAAGRPVVLTCRRDAYADAVTAAGTPLDRAAVIELEPITAAAAAAYLPAGQVDGMRRWAWVVAELRHRPDGPLAQALSTPLMVYLARTVYAAPSSDPAHLTDPTRFPSRAHIEAHLLEGYLPAVYAASAGPPDPVLAGSPRHPYDAEQARTWLTFLAARSPDSAAGDIAWWDLPRCVARWRRVAGVAAGSAAGLAGGLTTGTATALLFGPVSGLMLGLAAALYMSALCGLGYGLGRSASPAGRPRQVRLRLRTLLSPTRAGLIRGTQCALVVGLEVGAFLGLAVGFRHGTDAGINYGVLAALLVGPPVGVIELLVQNLTCMAHEPDAVTPRSSLAADRAATLLHASVPVIAFGPTYGLVVGMLTGPRNGLTVTLIVGAGAAVVGTIFTGLPAERLPGAGLQWVPFTIARTWLAARRRTPFRLLRFLEDARARGVLRQTGAAYQFRHARVREHLTAIPTAAPPHADSRLPAPLTPDDPTAHMRGATP